MVVLAYYFVPRQRLNEPSAGGWLLEWQAFLIARFDDRKWWLVNNGRNYQVEAAFLRDNGRIETITTEDVEQVDALYAVKRDLAEKAEQAKAAHTSAAQGLALAEQFLPVLLESDEFAAVADVAQMAAASLRSRLVQELAACAAAAESADAAASAAGDAITADIHRCSMVIAGRHYGYIPYPDDEQ